MLCTFRIRDRDRPLRRAWQAGRLASQDLGSQIISTDWSPDLILSSDAVRSRETVHEMSKSFTKAVPTEYLGSFYVTSSLDGHTRKLLEVVSHHLHATHR